MAPDSVSRRLLSALSDSTPAFTPRQASNGQGRSQRVLSALSDSTPAFRSEDGADVYTSQPPAGSGRTWDAAGPIARSRSWFQRLRSRATSGALRERIAKLEAAMELRYVGKAPVEVDPARAEAVAALLNAVAQQERAFVQVGSVIVIKVQDQVVVRNLSARDLAGLEAALEKDPALLSDPASILQHFYEIRERDQPGQHDDLSRTDKTHRSLGRLDAALDAAQRALTIAREHGDTLTEASALTNLGAIYTQLKRYDEAITAHQRALGLSQQVDDQVKQLDTLIILGDAMAAATRNDQAVDAFRLAVAQARKIGNGSRESTALARLGRALAATGQHAEANDVLQLALEIAQNAEQGSAP